MKNSESGKHKKQKSVSISFDNSERLTKEITDLRNSERKITENYNEIEEWEIKEYLKCSIQIVNFLAEELKKRTEEHEKSQLLFQEERSKIIVLESEKETSQKKEEKLQNCWSTLNSYFDNDETSGSQKKLSEQIEEVKNYVHDLAPNNFSNHILNFFGILGGAVVIIGTIWEQWQKKALRGQLDDLKFELKKNISNE